MATYASLTDEEKEALAIGDTWLRSSLVVLTKFTKGADFDRQQQFWASNVEPALDKLDAGQLIPRSTGHAGAKPLTKGEIAAIKTWLSKIDTDMGTNLAVVVKAIGVNAE